MEPRHPRWHDKQLEGRRLIPQIIVQLPMGDRVYSYLNPAINRPIGTNPSPSATFNTADFTGRPIVEVSDRLVELKPVEESVQPLDQDVLGAWGQAQRPKLDFELANGDETMGEMVGQEYILNQKVFLFFGFPNLDWDYSMLRYSGTVSRITLTKARLRIEAETLC